MLPIPFSGIDENVSIGKTLCHAQEKPLLQVTRTLPGKPVANGVSHDGHGVSTIGIFVNH